MLHCWISLFKNVNTQPKRDKSLDIATSTARNWSQRRNIHIFSQNAQNTLQSIKINISWNIWCAKCNLKRFFGPISRVLGGKTQNYIFWRTRTFSRSGSRFLWSAALLHFWSGEWIGEQGGIGILKLLFCDLCLVHAYGRADYSTI